MNVGEDIVAAYLQYIKKCEFVRVNFYIPDIQGEIDVIGINLNEKTVYICEVAMHLITGLQYVKDKSPNNINKLYDKFCKDIAYAKKYFSGYEKKIMLW
ncbi:YraN family protein, partial [Treponema endosymbiont of Eucomonympha sp.]|uniref:YraN family protein n=1 Tax=Treponema endosymbiont of Eucomonympha sp. TaxID=1580831 RepID=UPI000B204A8C